MSNSTAPLRIVSAVALTGALLNLFYSVYVVVVAFTKSNVQPGWTTLSLQQSGMFFLISIVMFLLTEYLAYMIRWAQSGAYFLASEATSAVLTRRQKLNVETAIAEAPSDAGAA